MGRLIIIPQHYTPTLTLSGVRNVQALLLSTNRMGMVCRHGIVYELYQRLLKDKDLVDFDDILFLVRSCLSAPLNALRYHVTIEALQGPGLACNPLSGW